MTLPAQRLERETDEATEAPPQARARSNVRTAAAGALGLGALALKFGKFLLLPLKAGKLWVTALSMLAMVWSQAVFHGWAFGIGFVLLILVHELGHAFEIRRSGLDSSWPVFVPFVGAFITLRGRILDVLTEARIGVAGPIAGTLASAACLAFWLGFERDTPPRESLFLSLALTGFFLNLFNLMPVRPLDGGRVFAALSRRASIVGLVLLGVAIFVLTSPMLILIGIFAVMSYFTERRRERQEAERYYAISREARLAMAGLYFGLVLALGAGMAFCYRALGSA